MLWEISPTRSFKGLGNCLLHLLLVKYQLAILLSIQETHAFPPNSHHLFLMQGDILHCWGMPISWLSEKRVPHQVQDLLVANSSFVWHIEEGSVWSRGSLHSLHGHTLWAFLRQLFQHRWWIPARETGPWHKDGIVIDAPEWGEERFGGCLYLDTHNFLNKLIDLHLQNLFSLNLWCLVFFVLSQWLLIVVCFLKTWLGQH